MIRFNFRCPMDWDAMDGDGTRRFCGSCSKHVTNLSNMTPTAARAFLERTAGAKVCVRATTDSAGRVQFAGASAAAVLAAGLTVAHADGQLPTLAPTTAETVDTTAIEAASPLENVEDVDCGSQAPGEAPATLGSGAEPDLAEPELHEEMFIMGDIAYIPPPQPVAAATAPTTTANTVEVTE